MIRLVSVDKTFRIGDEEISALRDVSIEFQPRCITAVMGPSGCGKSTLLGVAGGLQAPDRGSVTVGDVELASAGERELCRLRRQVIGFIFQSYNLIEMLSVVENVALPMELDGRSRRESRAAAQAALDDVGLLSLAARRPGSLSGGQRQRVAIARALTGGRTVLLADEPTGALDSDNSVMVMDTLAELAAAGVMCLLVTHDDQVAARAGTIVRMVDGRVVTPEPAPVG
jgi:putative ABC transport system ATP-binding protein